MAVLAVVDVIIVGLAFAGTIVFAAVLLVACAFLASLEAEESEDVPSICSRPASRRQPPLTHVLAPPLNTE